jgi:hypothetical protein
MWQIDNRTPFAADRGWVRDRDGAEIWLVAVKCTFDIKPDGNTEISEEQPPVMRVPEYYGEPGKSSIRYESDLILTKKTTDLIVVGHAYAPNSRPVQDLDVGFRVGPVQKILRVVGDRGWTTFGPSVPRSFVKMPLIYERAFGGIDKRSKHPECNWEWRNPVGTGFAVAKRNLVDIPLPNIEYPDKPFLSWDDRHAPAGFGAICSHWQPRASFAGTYDEKWMKERQPLLPHDFDDRFFQYAPKDQQAPDFFRGGEQVALLNLSPASRLWCSLPKLHLGFETLFYDGSHQIHKIRKLHSVILEPDFPRLSLVWHSALPCHFKVQKLDRTIITLKKDLSAGQSFEKHETDFEEGEGG